MSDDTKIEYGNGSFIMVRWTEPDERLVGLEEPPSLLDYDALVKAVGVLTANSASSQGDNYYAVMHPWWYKQITRWKIEAKWCRVWRRMWKRAGLRGHYTIARQRAKELLDEPDS